MACPIRAAFCPCLGSGRPFGKSGSIAHFVFSPSTLWCFHPWKIPLGEKVFTYMACPIRQPPWPDSVVFLCSAGTLSLFGDELYKSGSKWKSFNFFIVSLWPSQVLDPQSVRNFPRVESLCWPLSRGCTSASCGAGSPACGLDPRPVSLGVLDRPAGRLGSAQGLHEEGSSKICDRSGEARASLWRPNSPVFTRISSIGTARARTWRWKALAAGSDWRAPPAWRFFASRRSSFSARRVFSLIGDLLSDGRSKVVCWWRFVWSARERKGSCFDPGSCVWASALRSAADVSTR